MDELFLSAFGLAIVFAAQPGVIMFESIRRGVSRGWRAALGVELGSLVGDATWTLIALVGASVLFQYRVVALALSFFGCGLLLRFAWDAWQAARHGVEDNSTGDGKNDFVAGAMLSLSNPQNLTFALGISGLIIGLGFLDPKPIHMATFFVGFMLAQVCWCFLIAGIIGSSRHIMTPRLFRWINRVAAVVLVYFGLSLLVETARMAFGLVG